MALRTPGETPEIAKDLSHAFEERYGAAPDVVGHAPGRVNLIGEHTDYNAGLCLPAALPHRTYVAARARDDEVVRVASLQVSETWEGTLADATPETVSGWAAYAVGVLRALADDGIGFPGLDLLVDSTVPVGASLSSSAALESAVAVAALSLATSGSTSRQRVIEACIRAEGEFAGAPTGGMDQTIALRAEEGTALLIDFESHESRAVPIPTGAPAVLVVDTRMQHALNDGGYADRRASCERAAADLGVPSLRQASLDDLDRISDETDRRRARHVVGEIARVTEAVDALEAADWPRLGALFVASHASMRDDFEISCPELDAVVEAAMGAGADGARMTGGGFGGSAVALVPHDRVDDVVDAVRARFAESGWTEPDWLFVEPGGRADVL